MMFRYFANKLKYFREIYDAPLEGAQEWIWMVASSVAIHSVKTDLSTQFQRYQLSTQARDGGSQNPAYATDLDHCL